MNREETLALYERAQNNGVEVWNDWANERLEERKRLEKADQWQVDENEEPTNLLTKDWFNRAEANFSTEDNPHTFKNVVKFSNFIFPGTCLFEKATFKKHALFDNTNFKGFTIFDKAKFNLSANFEVNVKFHENCSFIGAVFKGSTSFENSKFLKESTFYEAVFEGIISFKLAKFIKNVCFQDSRFLKSAIFIDTEFHDIANFGSASFESSNFHHAKFEGWTMFSGAEFKKFTSFYSCTFNKLADFSAIQSKNAFTLIDSSFNTELPDFIQANFKEAPRLDNIEFGDEIPPGNFKNSITTFIHPDIKARYQALKRLAVQAHDHENEQRFWADVLRSDRSLRTEDGGWNLRPLVSAFWWGNIAYGFFSNYGRSIVLPLANFLAFILIMAGIHIYAHNTLNKDPIPASRTKTHITKQSDLKDCNIRSSAFRVAAKNGAIGLLQNPAKRSTFVRDYTCLYGTYIDNVTPKIPNTIFWIELFHTLFSAILIFLTLLGIRNNFKLK